MKRKFFVFTGLIVMSLLILAGCKKEDPTSLVLDNSKTAAISGEVYAQLDYSNSVSENAPSGTKLFFTVSNSDYLDGAQGVTVYETTVGSDGKYSINIPVTDEGVTITIEAEDFDFNVILPDGTTTQYTIFPGGLMTTVSAMTNGNYIRDLNY